MNKIENLVFEGGGVKGAAYAGCVQVLDEHNMLTPVRRVAGTSAGSITAAILAVGGGSKGLTASILDSHFNKFIYDKGWILGDIYRVFWHYGIHSGNSFVKILKGYFKEFVGNPEITFAQISEKADQEPEKYKHLSIIASNISQQSSDVFDRINTPDVPIWKAVRCSMSIPVLFEPFKVNDSYYVDGGIGWNYPIDVFDEKDDDGGDIINPATLGFFLEPKNQIKMPSLKQAVPKINSLTRAAEAMFAFVYNAANSKHIHPDDKKRTVFVDDLGVSPINFNISKEKIEALIASGRKATTEYLEKVAV